MLMYLASSRWLWNLSLILSWFYNETNTCNELHYYATTDLYVQKGFSRMLTNMDIEI